jgi:cell shape-determining protein MreD
LSICLPARESLPFILALGFMMDNISGSPFGLYLTVYFWLFVGVCWIARYLRMRNKIFLSFVVVAAVLIENVFVIGTFAVFRPSWQLPAHIFIRPVVGIQTLKYSVKWRNSAAGRLDG